MAERPYSQLEFKRGAQVDDAAIVAHAAGSAHVTRPIYYTARGAKDIRVGNSPARMVEKVTGPGEQVEALSFRDANALENRRVPRKRVSIANEKNLTKTAGRSVWQNERRIGSAVRTNQTLIDRQKLRGRRPGSVERGQRDS